MPAVRTYNVTPLSSSVLAPEERLRKCEPYSNKVFTFTCPSSKRSRCALWEHVKGFNIHSCLVSSIFGVYLCFENFTRFLKILLMGAIKMFLAWDAQRKVRHQRLLSLSFKTIIEGKSVLTTNFHATQYKSFLKESGLSSNTETWHNRTLRTNGYVKEWMQRCMVPR